LSLPFYELSVIESKFSVVFFEVISDYYRDLWRVEVGKNSRW